MLESVTQLGATFIGRGERRQQSGAGKKKQSKYAHTLKGFEL